MEDGFGYTIEALAGYSALLAQLSLDALFELSHNVHPDLGDLVIEAIVAALVA